MSGFSTARQKMVDGQVRPSDVTDSRIIDAMLTVPREVFVPLSQRPLAYLDLDLDVSEGGPIKPRPVTLLFPLLTSVRAFFGAQAWSRKAVFKSGAEAPNF